MPSLRTNQIWWILIMTIVFATSLLSYLTTTSTRLKNRKQYGCTQVDKFSTDCLEVCNQSFYTNEMTIYQNVTHTSEPKETSTTYTTRSPSSRFNISTQMSSQLVTTGIRMSTKKEIEKVLNAGNCSDCLNGRVLITVQKGWICSHPRLGNKLFMIAPAIAAAAKYNATFVLIQGDEKCEWISWLQELFITLATSTPLLPHSMIENWYNLGEPSMSDYEEVRIHNRNLTISGYRQTWKYFTSKVEQNALRKAFTFTDIYVNISLNNLVMAKPNYTDSGKPIYVGVHVRIGDLSQRERIKYGYNYAKDTFYSKALTLASAYFSDSSSLIFVIATDRKDVARQMFSQLESKYKLYWVEGSAFEDFATLSKCNHSIISGGTFGFWAAWLANGKTFYYTDFAKPGTEYSKLFDNKKFYPPEWIPV